MSWPPARTPLAILGFHREAPQLAITDDATTFRMLNACKRQHPCSLAAHLPADLPSKRGTIENAQ